MRAPAEGRGSTSSRPLASELRGRIAFAWPAMDAFYGEDERILGHAAHSYHRIDIRQAFRQVIVRRVNASSPKRSGR